MHSDCEAVCAGGRVRRLLAPLTVRADVASGPGEGLVADMNDQAQLRFQSRQAYAIGDTDRARALVEKLDPTRVTEEELRAKFGGPAPMNSKKPGGMKS